MIYRTLKLGLLSLMLAVGLFGGSSLIGAKTVSAQGVGGANLFLPFVTGGLSLQPVNTDTPWDSLQIAEAEAEGDAFERAIQEMEQNIAVDDNGQLIYDALMPLSSDVTPTMQRTLIDALAETNKKLNDGVIALDDLSWGDDEPSDDAGLQALGRCGGTNKVTYHWWGYKMYKDSCQAKSYQEKFEWAAVLTAVCTPKCVPATVYYYRIYKLIDKYNNGTGVIITVNWPGVISRVGSQ